MYIYDSIKVDVRFIKTIKMYNHFKIKNLLHFYFFFYWEISYL